MSFRSKISPSGAFTDIVTVWRDSGRSRYPLLVAACVPAALTVWLFYTDLEAKSVPPPPEIIYVESWPADRSIEDVLADQAEREKLRQAREERIRENYKALGRAVGMDVDAIEREAMEARAAAKAEGAKTESGG